MGHLDSAIEALAPPLSSWRSFIYTSKLTDISSNYFAAKDHFEGNIQTPLPHHLLPMLLLPLLPLGPLRAFKAAVRVDAALFASALRGPTVVVPAVPAAALAATATAAFC